MDGYLTVREVAEMHSVSATQVRNWIHDKRLPAKLCGDIYIIEEEAARAFVKGKVGRPFGKREEI